MTPTRIARTSLVAAITLSLAACGADLAEQALETVRAAVTYHRDSVSVNGGYLWRYTADLSDQWGEGHATRSQVWVQPPGTPRVGLQYVKLWQATGDSLFLSAARDAANALIYGQLECGGWTYRIDFDESIPEDWLYRNATASDRPPGRRRNVGTFDDNTTQEATRLLMAVDKATGLADSTIHEAATVALDYMLEAQFANGAWPQRYPLPEEYGRFYTFNDNSINDCIDVMLTAYETYADRRYLTSALASGDFIIASQYAAPQSGWAQQYDEDLKPAWARSFEPPAICSAVTLRNIDTLLNLYLRTGEDRFLAPIPAALEWLESSVIDIPAGYFAYRSSAAPYGRGWARLYEVGTNRPIFGDRDSKVHYTFDEISEERKRGYSWYRPCSAGRAEKYQQIVGLGREEYLVGRDAPLAPDARHARMSDLEPRVRAVIESLDSHGRWVDDGMIEMRTYVRNLQTLAEYLELVDKPI